VTPDIMRAVILCGAVVQRVIFAHPVFAGTGVGFFVVAFTTSGI
jgi:hypothetical protein